MTLTAPRMGPSLPGSGDTIVALATPPGRGALSVIRLSGPAAHAVARRIARRWPAEPRQAVLTALHDGDQPLDQAVIVRYDAPASFTGEDAVEISTHGGVVVPATVVAALIESGARMALPGEFTRRALLNGKLDVLQAEATADLIAATSRAAQRVALQQLDGGLSRRIGALRSDVLAIEALIAYDIDFPEEDDGPIAPERTLIALDNLEKSLRALLATARGGELVREGALVVLAGAPNVGKSSLFNAVLGRSRAIVTEIPGTTRDAIEAVIDATPFPLRLVDTAGLRPTRDPVERVGIEMSEGYVRRAAVILACGDNLHALRAAAASIDATIGGRAATVPPVVLVRTKADLGTETRGALATIRDELRAAAAVEVSAELGTGVPQLLESVGRVLATSAASPELDAPVLTQARHRRAIEQALDELALFRRAWQDDALPATIAAVHLHAAAGALQDVIGTVNVDDVLDEVFRRFCVGK